MESRLKEFFHIEHQHFTNISLTAMPPAGDIAIAHVSVKKDILSFEE
jgi:hypothetical protein